ncbi:MAG: flagellar protein FliT, partial [Lachnospiraceae bacterium]|nr:flagellar protein FliT [Lachnospiraceae bacterium]
MSEAYMSMLIASQEKKLELLEKAIELDREQEEIITGEKPDMGALDANINAKGALIDELDKLDDGFESLYAKVRDEFINNKEAHKEEIRTLQDLIRKITEKIAEVEAIEARSKINFESFMK